MELIVPHHFKKLLFMKSINFQSNNGVVLNDVQDKPFSNVWQCRKTRMFKLYLLDEGQRNTDVYAVFTDAFRIENSYPFVMWILYKKIVPSFNCFLRVSLILLISNRPHIISNERAIFDQISSPPKIYRLLRSQSCLCLCLRRFQFLIDWPILTKLGMDVMALEPTHQRERNTGSDRTFEVGTILVPLTPGNSNYVWQQT
jgi:hypothetical protein